MYFRNYDPANFSRAYDLWGARLEKFLCAAPILARLDASVEMKRPAAQAIAVPLLEVFGAEAQKFRFRQLVGHMIRHLMRQRGCEVDQLDVRIQDGVLFTRAARYRKVERALPAAR